MRVLLFITGFLSASVQFVFLREITSVSGNSESTTALFLALWLLLSAAGAMTAGKSRDTDTGRLILMLLAAPLVSLSLYLAAGLMLPLHGEVMPVGRLMVMMVLTLTPTAAVSAYTFVKLSTMQQHERGVVPGNSFGIETAGSFLGGILSTVTALLLLAGFQYYLLVLTISAVAAAIALKRPTVRSALAFYLLPASLVVTLLLIYPPDIAIRDIQLRNIRTTQTFDTPYGNITDGFYGSERTVFYNFRPLIYDNDEIRREEDIHYAMLQAAGHDSVLLISGGLGSHMQEILKYRPLTVCYSETDPGLLRLEEEEGTIEGPVSIIRKDAFRYLMKATGRFDVIIQLTGQPATLAENRYYTAEYFSMVKANLAGDGVFVCSPLGSYNYVTGNYISALSSIVNAMRPSFSNIIFIRGRQLYIIASDSALSTDICTLSDRYTIENMYVNCDFLDDGDITSKSLALASLVDTLSPANTLTRPSASWFCNRMLAEKYSRRKSYSLILVLLILLPLARVRRSTLLMYSSSAALAGLGITVITIFQATLGNAHLLSAIILSVLFTGLAAGAARGARQPVRQRLLPAGLVTILLFTSLLSLLIREVSLFAVIFSLLPPLVFAAGFITGAYYRMVTISGLHDATRLTYSADLAGAASGYLITGTVLIPLAGIHLTPLLLSLLILISIALVPVRSKL